MTWPRRLLPMLVAVTMLAGCASSQSAANTTSGDSTSGSAGAGKCNEPCVLFKMQINFTGLDSVQGSFVDNGSGEGYSSCADFAKGDSVGFVQGPGTPAGPATVVDGKTVTFLFDVTKDKFHGPGTYSDVLAASGLTIGTDTFFGNSSSETINADGSGQGSFSDLEGGSVTGAQGKESGTASWTCSK